MSVEYSIATRMSTEYSIEPRMSIEVSIGPQEVNRMQHGRDLRPRE